MNKKGEETSSIDIKHIFEEGNFFILSLVGVLIFFIVLIAIYALSLEGYEMLAVIVIGIIFFIVCMSFLLEPKIIEEITHRDIRVIEKPIVKIKEIPKQIVHEVEKTIYVTNPRKKQNKTEYEYVGSSETMTYHNKNCRLGKLIKGKNKVKSMNQGSFILKGFKGCKSCIGGKKKKK